MNLKKLAAVGATNAVARVVVLVSDSKKGPWTPMPPADVPEALKHPEVMSHIVEGSKVQIEGDDRWFAGLIEHSPLAIVGNAAPPGIH